MVFEYWKILCCLTEIFEPLNQREVLKRTCFVYYANPRSEAQAVVPDAIVFVNICRSHVRKVLVVEL